MWGKHDTVVPTKPNFERWQHLLSGGSCNLQVREYRDTGHAFFLEEPMIVLPDIAAFLNEASGGNEADLVAPMSSS